MKSLPAPKVPGRTPWERFDNALKAVLTVSKRELLKREAKQRQRKLRARKHG